MDALNGVQWGAWGNQSEIVFSEQRLVRGPRFEHSVPDQDQVDGRRIEDTFVGQDLSGIELVPNPPLVTHLAPSLPCVTHIAPNPPLVTHIAPSLSTSAEDGSQEDYDLSDAILGYISEVLMREDMVDQPCMLQDSLDLQAAEKPFYDVLGKKYPPSPQQNQPDLHDHDRFSLNEQDTIAGYGHGQFTDPYWCNYPVDYNGSQVHTALASSVSQTMVNSANSSKKFIDGFMDSPISPLQVRDLYNESQSIWQFKKGVEEASKFLPSSNNTSVNYNFNELIPQDLQINTSELASKVERKNEFQYSPAGSRGRKTSHRDDVGIEEERTSKLAAVYQESTVRDDEFDTVLLCSLGRGKAALESFRETLRNDKSKLAQQSAQSKGFSRGKGRGKKQNKKKEVIDLRTLLISCAQAVAADDRRNANELLKQIRLHSSPFGDGNQRLAHCFADGLESRLAGNANFTIRTKAKDNMRIHIIDFGILYGFQWPTFMQRILDRKCGPPSLRITGIDFPQPGFRPAERIEETGRRLADYARDFGMPFEYTAIAKRWETIKLEDLKIDKDEYLVVNCLYRAKNLLGDTVVVDSSRDIVLNLIRQIKPDIFVHGVINGAFSAPFFVTRFREALFHFSALFDMLETNVPREHVERMLIEKEIFGREALNVIACEGWERVERPETYKQWQVRNMRAGFVQLPFDRVTVEMAKTKVRLHYHKDFIIDEDDKWLLQGWKGRIIYALSCWKPV
ncbi:Scarecrow-like protein 9 [Heracleum sosnowskyi]|uniref:Scarecrow-like protein 9 n=1 Tax=Heracleum sosnowskyi TaxID=360622 RepID=A0AAD8I4T2_9APIA|nr:Scarecrow-like protein 9 [Heracleum sosnowskyi]